MKIVTAAVIRDGDKILIARRGPDSSLAGKWEFPGGKVEGSESLEICLRREIEEELGVRVIVGDPVCSSEFVYAHGEFRIEAFWVEVWEGKFRPKVHDRLEWVAPHDFGIYDLLPADVPIAGAVASHLSR